MFQHKASSGEFSSIQRVWVYFPAISQFGCIFQHQASSVYFQHLLGHFYCLSGETFCFIMGLFTLSFVKFYHNIPQFLRYCFFVFYPPILFTEFSHPPFVKFFQLNFVLQPFVYLIILVCAVSMCLFNPPRLCCIC